MRIRMVATLAGLVTIASAAMSSAAPAQSQRATAGDRTRVIVASFNKSKHVIKDKRGVRREKYKEVRSEPVVKANPAEYSGTYEVPDMGFVLELRVDRGGKVEGSGYEPVGGDNGVLQKFTLRNGRIEGALLTATQVYANGVVDRFEGVFINRSSFESPTDKGTTEFGLGVVGKEISFAGNTFDKFFFQKTR